MGQERDEVELPEELRGRPFASVELAAFALADLREAKDPELAHRVREVLRDGWPLGADLSAPAPEPKQPGLNHYGLVKLFHRVDPAELLEFLQIGTERTLPPPRLPDLELGGGSTPVPDEEPDGPDKPVLTRSNEGAAVLEMARAMAAAVQLPRPGPVPEDLVAGGYTDISNRGSLERLLLSELSHDDDVLATRLILGEALFLRRETAAAPPTPARHVLIDYNIRSWGMTRLVQGAAAVAVGLDAPEDARVTYWIAADGGLRSMDLERAEDLSEHLGVLGKTLHGADLLREFLRRTDEATGAEPQRVIVVPKKTLSERAFREALSGLGRSFVIAASPGGELEINLFSSRGSRTLRNAQVEVCSPEPDAAPNTWSSDEELPAYLRAWPSPLLLKHNNSRVRWRRAHSTPERYFALTKDMRVLVWDERHRESAHKHAGAREVAVLPRGELLYFNRDGESMALAVWHKGSPRSMSLWTVSAHEKPAVQRVPLTTRPTALYARDGAFAIVHGDRVDVVRHGEVHSSPGFVNTKWKNHFLRRTHQEQWERLDLNENGVTTVPSTAADAAEFHAQKDQFMESHPDLRYVYRVSFARPAAAISFHMTDDDVWIQLEERVNRILGQRKGFHGFAFHMRNPTDSPMARRTRREFSPDHGEGDGVHRFLARAHWPCGSKAWTDKRGLLHLESGDEQIGSMTFALHVDAAIAAWCDDGWSTEAATPHQMQTKMISWVRRFVTHISAEARP